MTFRRLDDGGEEEEGSSTEAMLEIAADGGVRRPSIGDSRSANFRGMWYLDWSL